MILYDFYLKLFLGKGDRERGGKGERKGGDAPGGGAWRRGGTMVVYQTVLHTKFKSNIYKCSLE